MRRSISYLLSAAALAASACAPAQRVEVYTGGTHTLETVVGSNPACIVRKHEEYCTQDPGSMECRYPALSRECLDRQRRVCSADFTITTTDNDGDEVLEPEEEEYESREYDCVDAFVPASTR